MGSFVISWKEKRNRFRAIDDIKKDDIERVIIHLVDKFGNLYREFKALCSYMYSRHDCNLLCIRLRKSQNQTKLEAAYTAVMTPTSNPKPTEASTLTPEVTNGKKKRKAISVNCAPFTMPLTDKKETQDHFINKVSEHVVKYLNPRDTDIIMRHIYYMYQGVFITILKKKGTLPYRVSPTQMIESHLEELMNEYMDIYDDAKCTCTYAWSKADKNILCVHLHWHCK